MCGVNGCKRKATLYVNEECLCRLSNAWEVVCVDTRLDGGICIVHWIGGVSKLLVMHSCVRGATDAYSKASNK